DVDAALAQRDGFVEAPTLHQDLRQRAERASIGAVTLAKRPSEDSDRLTLRSLRLGESARADVDRHERARVVGDVRMLRSECSTLDFQSGAGELLGFPVLSSK